MVMTDAKRIFVDTNVLIRATITSAPLHQEARVMLNRLSDAEVELWISPQVIREYIVNATRGQTYAQPVATDEVLDQIRRFRSVFQVAEETTAVLDRLLSLVSEVPLRGKQVHDINIVATMLVYEIDTLIRTHFKNAC